MSAENESDLSRLLRDVARAPSQDPPADLAGRRVGRYVLVESIGRGGMGEVWRARDQKLARSVAVKLLMVGSLTEEGCESADDARARFLREAQAAAALAHPNICAVYIEQARRAWHARAAVPPDGTDKTRDVLALVHDQLPVGIWLARAKDGSEVYANARFAEILGLGLQDAAAGGYAAPYGIHDRSGAVYPEERMPFVRALRERGPVEVDDIVIHRPDGHRAYVRAFAKPLLDDTGEPEYVVIAFVDISREVAAQKERELSETRAQRAARMASVGKLAGGIAHDFNNMLAVVRTTAFLLEKETDPARRASDLALIREMSDRAAALTRSLLSFTGRPAARREPVDLAAVVQNLAPIFERAVDARIKVTVDARSARTVLGDAAELEQIVMNLVMNGRDAMPEGGALSIDVRDDAATTTLVVSDSGRGIPLELRERVFEPYFTTKSARAFPGAGLGLATVYGVVQGHGGTVVVDDAPGGGARITIRLPSVPNEGVATAPQQSSVARVQAGAANTERPRVLLAEDDDVVRFVSERALISVGYHVVTACDGDEAIAVLEARGAELAAVLLDVHMPGCGGVGAFRRARTLFPTLPILFITGYSDDEEQRQIVEMGADACLQKPVAIELLDAELRRLIASSATKNQRHS